MKNFNINLEEVKRRLTHFSWKRGLHRAFAGSGPEGDWKVIILSSLLATLIIIATSTYIFVVVNRGDIFEGESSAPNIKRTLDVDKLRETTRYYQEKRAKFENIKETRLQSPDPSL